MSLRAWLMKPIFDDVLLAAPAAASSAPGALQRWIQRLGAKGLRGLSEAEGTPVPKAAPTPAPVPPSPAERATIERTVRDSLVGVLLVALIVILALPATEFGKNYLVEWTLGRVLVDIQAELCGKLLRLPLSFHHATTRGDTLSRILNDAGRAHRSLDLLFGDVVPSAVGILVGVAVLLSISWQLTLGALVIAPPVIGVIAVFGRRIRKSSRRRQEKIGDVTQRLVEILAGIKVIKSFRAERAEEAAFARENRLLFRRSLKVVKNRVLAKSLTEFLNNAVGVGLLVVGMLLVLRGQWGITKGDLAAFFFVVATTYPPLKALAKGWTELMDALPAAERFFELLDAPGELPDAADAVRLDRVHDGVRFERVSFSYGREPVLRDVSLDVKAGEMVAIVGRTGSGKTTLVDLLLRFYDPDSGAIFVDGHDLRRVTRDSLLDQLAVVTQEPFLFAGTIRDNIRYGRPSASDADVLAAARAAHVDEFAAHLPDGYDTEVGEVGTKLSGGQRQRITIARAILKNPAILIFDEATSSLDAQSERSVQAAIDALLGGRTVFVIAHRLSTVRNADRIVVIENGTIARVGSHDELMASDNLYRELVSLQSNAG